MSFVDQMTLNVFAKSLQRMLANLKNYEHQKATGRMRSCCPICTASQEAQLILEDTPHP